jgi:hypothetical protein
MARLNLVHLGLEAAVEAAVVVEATEAIEMIVTGEDVTEAIVIQMTGRNVVRMIELMASEMIEIAVTTKGDVDEVDEMTKVPATTTETVSAKSGKRRMGMIVEPYN